MTNIPEFIPMFIKQNINMLAGTPVTADVWNELFNLNIAQGDNNTQYLTQLQTALAQILVEIVTEDEELLELINNKADANDVHTKQEITELLLKKANIADVYTKLETYNQSEIINLINERVVEIGSADMQKAVYDTNSDGTVDNADNASRLNGYWIDNKNENNETGFGLFLHFDPDTVPSENAEGVSF